MGEIFLKILNMSISASWLILAVMLLRFALKKAPRWISVLLWGIVALRLALPFSFESALSLIPTTKTFNAHNIQYEMLAVSSKIPAINNAVNPVLGETSAPNPAASINPFYVWTFIVSIIWCVGIAAMLLYAAICYLRVRKSVAERIPYEKNIFLCDQVKSPFILGLVRPKIYLPSDMDAMVIEPVIAHEKAHLARCDHWWKPMGFLILALHWFNPLCWAAYMLLCKDIELACDEKVIRQMDLNGKKHYSAALLECSAGRRLVTICPLAFGEVGVKERVKNVLNHKKPAFWVIVVAGIACAVVTVCFATDPKQNFPQEQRVAQLGMAHSISVVSQENSLEKDRIKLQKLTLEDVIMLSQKGEALTWSDFGQYRGQDIGSGLYIMCYEIDELFDVLVGGVLEEIPMYICLRVNNEAEDSIDIRTGDVSAFIEAHRNNVPNVESKPEESDFSILPSEQTAIQKSILGHNRSPETPTDILSCCSFVTLDTVSETSKIDSNVQRTTYYGWALYQEYRITENGLETVSGSHIPVALTFEYDDYGYSLLEYWEPRDGSYFAQDIREKFPAHIAEDGMDSQKFIPLQIQECYAQAVVSTGLDTNQVIGTLIKTICSSPAQSSNLGDYIREHFTEYQELTYYGQYTLEYCFARFEQDGETGLPGQIMAYVCGEIAVSWGEEPLVFSLFNNGVLTGRMWYSAFKNNALSLLEQYGEIELAKYPASYILLCMLGKVSGTLDTVF